MTAGSSDKIWYLIGSSIPVLVRKMAPTIVRSRVNLASSSHQGHTGAVKLIFPILAGRMINAESAMFSSTESG